MAEEGVDNCLYLNEEGARLPSVQGPCMRELWLLTRLLVKLSKYFVYLRESKRRRGQSGTRHHQ